MQELKGKPEIDYPCRWQYTLIGSDETVIRQAVLEMMDGQEYTLRLSNASATGKYCSLALSLTVQDETQRLSIYQALIDHHSIKIVL